MTKPLMIEIDEAAAERLVRIANDLGETPEQFAARVVAASIESCESNVFFARRAKGIDREAAIAWLSELAGREGGPEPDPDDRLPEDYARAVEATPQRLEPDSVLGAVKDKPFGSR